MKNENERENEKKTSSHSSPPLTTDIDHRGRLSSKTAQKPRVDHPMSKNIRAYTETNADVSMSVIREGPLVYVQDGVSVDAGACDGRPDIGVVRQHAQTLIASFNGRGSASVGMRPLSSLILGNGFHSTVTTSGYCATLTPDATVNPDVVHDDCANGCIAGMRVDLSSPEWSSLTAPDGAQDALSWACRIGESYAGNGYGPAYSALPRGSEEDDTDAKKWRRGIVGAGFAGVYGLLDKPTEGMIVVCSRALADSAERKKIISGAGVRPTYRQMAVDRSERLARLASERNVRRMLHEAAVRLGFSRQANAECVADVLSVPNSQAGSPPAIPVRGKESSSEHGDDLEDILDVVRNFPLMARPAFVNEIDVFQMEKTEIGAEVVRYYDGMCPIATAKGAIVALADGNPGTGLYVMPIAQYRLHSEAGPFASDPGVSHGQHGWEQRQWVHDAANLYTPIVVSIVQ